MKRLLALILPLCLLLTLISCTPKQSSPPFPQELPQTLLQTEAFSEPLEPLDAEILPMLYGLEDSGLAPEALTDTQAYRSSGATCEEVCLLTCSDESAAQTAVHALELYLEAQIQSNQSYRPAEIPKLEQAILERRGTTVLLLVAADYTAAAPLL